jgi:hypothetical protein
MENQKVSVVKQNCFVGSGYTGSSPVSEHLEWRKWVARRCKCLFDFSPYLKKITGAVRKEILRFPLEQESFRYIARF